jgi:hypothetical protein
VKPTACPDLEKRNQAQISTVTQALEAAVLYSPEW